MSGGSFNYLHHKSLGLGEPTGDEDLARMLAQLEELFPNSKATKHTRNVIELTKDGNDLVQQLGAVWQAVEWWRSGDWGQDQVFEEVERYEKTARSGQVPAVKLIYMAHPYGGDPENLQRAKRWLRWAACEARRENAFVLAPWIPLCEVFSGSERPDDTTRAFMLNGDCETVRSCKELWLCGDSVSPGMRQEQEAAAGAGILIRRFFGMEPPAP